ncbi:hypothetical protein K474DRAFT_1599387 [Panus rudis PR-1116 ss-1]|nr:hypothetical protein K474DRAFT_1599387 [Panus rudis PR-1116 ss-1]
MKHDAAEEAALGLLGLQSVSVSTIPLKRKSSAVERDNVTNHGQQQHHHHHHSHNHTHRAPTSHPHSQNNTTTGYQQGSYSKSNPNHSTSTTTTTTTAGTSTSTNSDAIRCICGFDYDDGFSIACDVCQRWVHAACFGMFSQEEVPDEFRCWVCDPRPGDPLARERAVKLQKARMRQMGREIQQRNGSGDGERRKTSPGVERKSRKTSATALGASTSERGGASGRKRGGAHLTVNHFSATTAEDKDTPLPGTDDYVLIDADEIPHQETRDKLKRLAQNWRSVTALEVEVPSPGDLHQARARAHTTLKPLPLNQQYALASVFSSSSSSTSPSTHYNTSSTTLPPIRPPTYALHTTTPIPSHKLIAPYTSLIVPSSQYLSDPLNAYAHLSMPKPYVHLIGKPLDVALDARTVAGREGARWVRSGCRPNAVLRPMVCRKSESTNSASGAHEAGEEKIAFGVFALRDLKPNEEVVLGWEWDDGSVIHRLPALIESPHMFE